MTDTTESLRAVLDKWREFAHNYDLPCDTDTAFDECWDALASALARLEAADRWWWRGQSSQARTRLTSTWRSNE